MKSAASSRLRRVFGGGVVLLAVAGAIIGTPWYLCAGVALGGMVIMLGERTIFRAGVVRYPDRVECRYVPWYEGNAWGLCVLLPLAGVCAVYTGSTSRYPAWLSVVGVALLALSVLFIYATLRMRKRCLLTITPTALIVQLPKSVSRIARADVDAIRPTVTAVGARTTKQIEIIGSPEGSEAPEILVVGIQFTVQPENLLAALQAWKGDATDHGATSLESIAALLQGKTC